MDAIHEENIKAYELLREKLESEHEGQVALFNEGKLVRVYSESGEAYVAGCEKFGLGNFTLFNIGEQPISLGILTLCLPD